MFPKRLSYKGLSYSNNYSTTFASNSMLLHLYLVGLCLWSGQVQNTIDQEYILCGKVFRCVHVWLGI